MHFFVKDLTDKKTTKEVKDLSKAIINELLEKIDQETIRSDLYQKLEIHTDDQDIPPDWIVKSHEAELYQALHNMKAFPHIKGKAYSDEQLQEFGQIIDKFPKDHSKIGRALKIPKSTFRRLKDKWSAYNDIDNRVKQKQQQNWKLSTLEQVYIRKLVRPPTTPKTIKSI